MSQLESELQNQDAFIKDILAISNCPALSLGVVHNGEIIHTAHYGTREVGKQLPPNDDTIYRMASLTKSMTACAVGALVDDGLLEWDKPIKEYLPGFRERKDEVGLKATVRDLLSNRTGLAGGDSYWGQQYGEFLLPHDELVRTAVHNPAVKPFRKKFVYAGWNFGLVTEVVEAVAGMTLGQYVEKRFFKPLGMKRTTLADTHTYDNVSLGYGLDTDGSQHHISFQQMSDGLGLAGAYAGKSSIKDLMLFYKGLMSAQQDQARSGSHKSPGSPFAYTKEIFEPHINVFASTDYCLGLYKTVLPGLLGIASPNTISWLGLKNSPVTDTDLKGLEVWHHTGIIPGFLASAFLIPKTQTAVVAMTNAVGLMDPTDFVTQRLLAVILGDKLDGRLIDLAKAARVTNTNQYSKLHAKLLKGRTGDCKRPVESYEGYYWNAAGNFCLTITRQPNGGLRMKVQDVPRTGYDLEAYDGDVWWWPPNRKEELCKKGMQIKVHSPQHLISFSSTMSGQVDKLSWQHDPTAGPETFYRRDEKPRWKGYPFPKANL